MIKKKKLQPWFEFFQLTCLIPECCVVGPQPKTTVPITVPGNLQGVASTFGCYQIPSRGNVQNHTIFVPVRKENYSFATEFYFSLTQCGCYLCLIYHLTNGKGKPSTVQKSLMGVFSYTVWDLSRTTKLGPLIIGSSRTYFSFIFVVTQESR